MAIRGVVINSMDVAASTDFYARFLGVEVVEQTEDEAVLDAVTARIHLRRVEDPPASTFVADDLQAGFRHVGFKVSDLDARVAALHEAGVPFHLEPIDAEGGVRLTFFRDPDGTMLELVEGPLQYHEVHDRDLVDADWGLGDPDRPRFDHVAETVADLAATREYWAPLGWRLMGGIHQPNDPRGYEIAFLRSGDTSLEVFTFERAELAPRKPQPTALGFAAIEVDGATPPGATALGDGLLADPDGLVHRTAGA